MIMYKYPQIVDHLKNQGNKKSAATLDKIFFSLTTEYLPCTWFVEAGAFEASISMMVKSKLPNCNVYAFEANPDNYNHFKENLSRVNYIQLAISDHVGKVIFKQQALGANGMVFSKIRGNNGLKLRTLDKETQYNDIEVPCTTLNDFFGDKLNEKDIVGMWVDLEGTAYEAFTAATKILDRVSFLKVEVEDKQYWEDQKLSQDVVNFLSLHGMVPVIRDFEARTVLQYNILFCNSKLVTPELSTYLNGLIND